MQRTAWTEPYTLAERVELTLYDRRLRFRAWRLDGWARAIAQRLPDHIVLWCFIRVMGHASTVHGDRHPNSITYEEAYKAWEARR